MKVIKYLTTFVNTTLRQISVKLTNFYLFKGDQSKHNYSISLRKLVQKSMNTSKLQGLYCRDISASNMSKDVVSQKLQFGGKSQKCSKDKILI